MNRTFPIPKTVTHKAERGTINLDRFTVKRGTLFSLGMNDMGIKGIYRNERCFPFNSDRNSKKTEDSKAKFEIIIILLAVRFRGIFHFLTKIVLSATTKNYYLKYRFQPNNRRLFKPQTDLTLACQCAKILFSLELTLAKANFFFPPSSLGGCGLAACGRGGGCLSGEEFKTE